MAEKIEPYPIDQCDVTDKKSLAEFRRIREKLIDFMSLDTKHAVLKQIYRMMWNSSVYNIINESRRIAMESDTQEFSSLNGLIASFIDYTFLVNQSICIRRLLDKRNDVVSLRAVLDKIKSNKSLFTRENYVCFDGNPYDYELAEKTNLDLQNCKPGKVNFYYGELRGPKAYFMSQLMHEKFDSLCGEKENRSRSDRISDDVFEKLENALERSAAKNFERHVNKFIAHAGNEGSRKSFESMNWGPTLQNLHDTQKAICQVALAVYGEILWVGDTKIVPTANFDKFENLGKPWIEGSKIANLNIEWEKFEVEIESWKDESLLGDI